MQRSGINYNYFKRGLICPTLIFVALPAYSITIGRKDDKGGKNNRSGLRCGSVETCRNVPGVSLPADEAHMAEAFASKPGKMASLTLKNVKKIYPHSGDQKKGKKHRVDTSDPNEEKVNLQVTEKGVIAVQEFNLDIADKEFIVLVGPSGCGKSTTLRMIAGLEEISEGELYIDDRLVNDVEPKDRDIAMVFQSYAL